MSSFDIMNSLHRILALYPHVRPYVTKHDIFQCDLFLPPKAAQPLPCSTASGNQGRIEDFL